MLDKTCTATNLNHINFEEGLTSGVDPLKGCFLKKIKLIL